MSRTRAKPSRVTACWMLSMRARVAKNELLASRRRRAARAWSRPISAASSRVLAVSRLIVTSIFCATSGDEGSSSTAMSSR